MVVYHGTSDEFTEFKYSELSDREGSFFFAQNYEDASAYSGTGNVMPVYVNLQNPIDYNNMPSEIYKLSNKHAQVDALKKLGYDGWLADIEDGWGEISAFYPEQVKSATDNIGTFDDSNPDIRYSTERNISGGNTNGSTEQGPGNNVLSESSEWTDDASAGEQTGSLRENEFQTQDRTETERKSTAEELRAKGQTKEEIINIKSSDKIGKIQVELINQDAYNADMRSMVDAYKKAGIELELFLDDGKVAFDGAKNFVINGFKIGNSKMYLRYDGTHSPQTLGMHELIHINWSSEAVQSAKDQMLDSITEDEKNNIFASERYQGYMEIYNGDTDAVWQEFVADTLSGMNEYQTVFDEIVAEFWNSNPELIDIYKVSEYTESIDTGNIQDLFNPHNFDYDKLDSQIDRWLSGDLYSNELFELGDTPYILQVLGADNLPVVMTQDALAKVAGLKHAISLDTIRYLPELINEPLMVFKSNTVDNAYVMLTEDVDKEGNQIIAVLHINKREKHYRVNRVASVYGKYNIERFINEQAKLGNIKYIDNKKIQDQPQSRGLQLPKLADANPVNNIILQKEDIVNIYRMQSSNNYSLIGGMKTSKSIDTGEANFAIYNNNDDGKLTKSEWKEFYNSLGELQRGMWFPQTSDGDYIFETSNKLIFTDENYNSPRINSIVVFKNLNTEEVEYGKEMAFYAAQRGEVSEECYEAIRDVLGQEYVTRTNPYLDKAYQGSKYNQRKRNGVHESDKTDGSEIKYSLKDDGVPDLFEAWDSAVKTYGTIPKGENPARDIEVPKRINKKQYVNRFARTMMEAEVTPDEALPEFERLILEGKMTHEVITNKKARETAIQTISEDGFADLTTF